MSELDGIGRVTPGDRPGGHAGRKKPDREFEDETESDEEQTDEASGDEDGTGRLPEDVRRRRREGREIGPPAEDEEGRIIDVLA